MNDTLTDGTSPPVAADLQYPVRRRHSSRERRRRRRIRRWLTRAALGLLLVFAAVSIVSYLAGEQAGVPRGAPHGWVANPD